MRAFSRHIWFLSFLGLIFIWPSCKLKNNHVDLTADTTALHILKLQDLRDSKSLIHYLKSKQAIHREMAALAFASIRDTSALPWLYVSLLSDGDSAVRKSCALAIGHTADSTSATTLIEALRSEPVRSVQAVILEAIGRCGGQKAIHLLKTFGSKQNQLTEAHAMAIYRLALKKQTDPEFLPFLRECLQTPAAATALHAWHRAGFAADTALLSPLTQSKQAEVQRMAKRILQANKAPQFISAETFRTKSMQIQNPYQIAVLLKNLHPEDPQSMAIWLEYTQLQHPACIRSHAADMYTRYAAKFAKPEAYLQTLQRFLLSGDMALQSLAALALIDSSKVQTSRAKTLIPELQQARRNLLLPRDTETQRDLDLALSILQQTSYVKKPPLYNHPPDWKHIQNLPDTLYIQLITNKGSIYMQWYTLKAPASVSNISKLVDSGFYNGKYFHRVVSDFVIQGGCPRGDGWGALNWSQRTEVSNYLKYTRGTVGLASAGPDTEGVQFFITHVPTPNLEGNYTILGYVYQGMEIVDQIQEGDHIIQMKRVKHP